MWHRTVISSKTNPLTLVTFLQNGDSNLSRCPVPLGVSWCSVPAGVSRCSVPSDGAPRSFIFSVVASSGASLEHGFGSRPQNMSKAFQRQPWVSFNISGVEGIGKDQEDTGEKNFLGVTSQKGVQQEDPQLCSNMKNSLQPLLRNTYHHP